MAVPLFCELLQQLVAAATVLDPVASPTLSALALFGCEFKALPPPAPVAPPEEDGWSLAPKGKKLKVTSTPCHPVSML
jgi:hypothetical protein